jgi:hypothetical protein
MTSFNDRGFPIVNLSNDGWSTETEATASCFCGAVQLILVSLYVLEAMEVPENVDFSLSCPEVLLQVP